jgi:hypothetical protein
MIVSLPSRGRPLSSRLRVRLVPFSAMLVALPGLDLGGLLAPSPVPALARVAAAAPANEEHCYIYFFLSLDLPRDGAPTSQVTGESGVAGVDATVAGNVGITTTFNRDFRDIIDGRVTVTLRDGTSYPLDIRIVFIGSSNPPREGDRGIIRYRLSNGREYTGRAQIVTINGQPYLQVELYVPCREAQRRPQSDLAV